MDNFERLSLKKIDVTGNVIGKFSSFSIHQEYRNDTDAVLEVTYTFPISATATVIGFTATIGDKIIKGKVKEKKAAQKEYEKEMVKGNSAYMMTNDESNIFRMNIGKIAIGETVLVQIDYIDNFEIVDNQIRMLIPTLVPPRYKSKVTDKLSYAKYELEYRGNVTIHLDKDLKIDDVISKTHSIKLENNTITAKDIKLYKDFVLDVKLAEQSFSKGYCCDLPNGKKLVYLSFFPEIGMEHPHTPKDYIFVIDISGSMSGYKIEQTKEAVIRCLKQLREGDKFNVIVFERRYELFSEKMMEFNPENFEKVKKYVQ
jgi:Ca-activated chloride channel family protein